MGFWSAVFLGWLFFVWVFVCLVLVFSGFFPPVDLNLPILCVGLLFFLYVLFASVDDGSIQTLAVFLAVQ